MGGGVGGLGWGSLGLVGCSDGVVYRWWDLGVGGLGVLGSIGGSRGGVPGTRPPICLAS